MQGPVLQRAVFGSASPGTGYEFSLSASDWDPRVNAAPASGETREIHLWLTCSEQGLSALEWGVNSTLPLLGFEPAPGVLNAGTPSSPLLAVGGCPSGNPASRLLGHWVVLDNGGTLCVGPSEGAVFGTVDCHPIDPQIWSDPQVTGFASDGSVPCVVGTNQCYGPTAFALSGLHAAVVDRHVEVSWLSPTDLADDVFRVRRREVGSGELRRLMGEPAREGNACLWVDAGVEGDRTYAYEVGIIRQGGDEERYGPVTVTTPVWPPLLAGLRGAHPNPVSEETRVHFTVAEAGRVRLSLYDVAGRLIERLADGPFPAGEHDVRWSAQAHGRRLPGGIYFVRMETGGRVWSRKLVLLGSR
jgi:hypothetical protein